MNNIARDQKVIAAKAPRDGGAFVRVDETSIILSAGGEKAGEETTSRNGFITDKDLGNAISGPLSILARPKEIRIGGMWRMNNLLTACIPSTTYTPIPVLKPVPDFGLGKDLMDLMKEGIKAAAAFIA